MSGRVYFTILDILEYIPSNEFRWDKAINFVSNKLNPYFTATMGSYCDNISNFRKSYKLEPIYVPVDNCLEVHSGQLFILRDIVNNGAPITNFPMLTEDTILKEIAVISASDSSDSESDGPPPLISASDSSDSESDGPPPLISTSDSSDSESDGSPL